MTKHHHPYQEVFKFGWAKTKQHAWFMALTFIISFIIISASSRTPGLNIIVEIMVGLSLASISLLIVRDHHFTFADLVNPLLSHKRVLKFFVLVALYAVPIFAMIAAYALLALGLAMNSSGIVTLGTILSIVITVCCVYISVRLKFFPFIVIEHENASIQDLVKMSYDLTKGHFWCVLGFILLLAILNLLGFMLFLVGLIITVPVSLFATARFYEFLKSHEL